MGNNLQIDSLSSRCYGLIKRTALKQIDNKPVHADSVTKKDGPFYCASCLSDAIHRKCTEKNDHFAHKARQSDVILGKDKELHENCINEILSAFQKKYPNGNWGKNRLIPKNHRNKGNNEIIPDISGRINDKGVCIEVQASAYTCDKISKKTSDYNKLGIYVLWIVPLYEELGDEPFRPRLYEKYLHSIYFGRVYYYTLCSKSLILPVHFSPAKRWIEESSWYESSGFLRTEGGYFLTYRTIKKPNYSHPIDLTEGFHFVQNEGFIPINKRKAVPKCLIYLDKLSPWWEKDEYKDTKIQYEVIKKHKSLFLNYEYADDYDGYETKQ